MTPSDINSIADFANRSLMGAAQEKCSYSNNSVILIYSNLKIGFLDTLDQSKERGAIWRVIG